MSDSTTGSGGVSSPVGPTDGGTGITTYTKGDILYSDATNSLAKLPINTLTGAVLTVDDTGLPKWGNDILNESEEFLMDLSFTLICNGWRIQKTATGAVAMGAGVAGHPGIIEMGVTAFSDDVVLRKGALNAAINSVVMGGGVIQLDWIVNIPTLSDGTDNSIMYFGFQTTTTGTVSAGTDAIVFQYDHATSTNWRGLTTASSTTTVASGGTNVAVDTNWTHLQMIINAAATQVDFYVDGVLIGSSTTNIPTAAMVPTVKSTKTLGSAVELITNVDTYRLYQNMTTSRFS